MNIDLIKKIIDNKISKGLDKNLPDAHIFGWIFFSENFIANGNYPEPPMLFCNYCWKSYELVNVKLDNNNYRCECAYIDLDIDSNAQKNVRRIKFIIIGLEEYNFWLSENREFLINKIL